MSPKELNSFPQAADTPPVPGSKLQESQPVSDSGGGAGRRGWRLAEVGSWCCGLLLCGFFLTNVVQGEVRRVQDLERAELAWSEPPPDMSLWSETRIRAWDEARMSGVTDLLAVLDMPDLGLKVPVYASASDLDMDRGAGWIPGTARPGEAGNIGIAGHRDGYFRALKDAEVGDTLRLRTSAGLERYVIDEILIVDPLDIEVLDPTDRQTLTMVTCYPFYFVGSAPQRYIVRAVRAGQPGLDGGTSSSTLTASKDDSSSGYPQYTTSAL